MKWYPVAVVNRSPSGPAPIERTAKIEGRAPAPILAPAPDPDVAPELDPQLALERQEVAATIPRFRVAAVIALGPWVAGFAVDWLIEPEGRPWVYLVLRLLGAAVIVISWLLTLVYVRWMNRHYDATLARLRR